MSHSIADSFHAAGVRRSAGLLPRLSEAWVVGRDAAHRYLLFLRFLLVNLAGLALFAVAWLEGWVGLLLEADRTRLVRVIVLVFLVGLVWCGQRALAISRELNALKAREPRAQGHVARYLRQAAGLDGAGRGNLAAVLRIKLYARIAPIRHLANTLVLLGLIGTVIGFIIALSGVDPELASDVAAVGPMIATLIDGMSVALHTTLVGSLLNIWLMVAYRIVEGGVVRLFTQAVEMGEGHVRP